MKKLTLLIVAAILAFGFPACSDNTITLEVVDGPKKQNLPTIDMVATHAIDLDISVAQLTFVPNSVAPWLGRIILLDDDGFLYSTDIEGRDPKPVGTGKYIDIFGLAREAAPGVFLAINMDNQIEAFIESDDDGNFSPMIYSGMSIDAKAFCLGMNAVEDSAKALTVDGKFRTLSFLITKNSIAQTELETTIAPKRTVECSYDVLNTGQGWSAESAPKKMQNSISGAGVIGAGDARFSFIAHNNNTSSMIVKTNGPHRHKVDITNGLSVQGVKNVRYINSTQSNYGGGAYADGVLALVDKDENRIVFISLSYAERKLLEAVNPPESATAETPQ